jgi:hypothetical protein
MAVPTSISRRAFGVSALALVANGTKAASIWPTWANSLRSDLERMAKNLTARLKPWSGPALVVTPEVLGHTRGALATKAIQAAIDSAAQRGGGTVQLAEGDYVSGTLDLRSNVRLEIAKGARLLASLDLADFPERVAKRPTVMDSNMGMNQSLIFAEGCTNIALAGEGTIDGRGASFKGEETIHGTPGRPFLIRVIDCQKVHVSGLTMKDSPCWMQNYLNCDDLLVEGLNVENQANFNNDGLDIDGCRNVIVRNCTISSGDDSLCFKGAAQRPTENVLIENCTFLSSCNALKLGTDSQSVFRNVLARHLTVGGVSAEMRHIKPVGADSGISWEVVDGGTAENILATDIHIVRARSPLFLRIDDRGRVRPGEPKPPVGTLRRVVFERITGEDNGPRGSYFIGIPAKLIEDVALRNVHLSGLPTTKPVLDEAAIPEMYGVYPDAHMLDTLGDAPAYGLWTRHLSGLTLVDVKMATTGPDPRPMLKTSTDTVNVHLS